MIVSNKEKRDSKKKTKIKTLKELALFGVFAFNNFNIENYFQILGKYSLQNYC